MHMSDFHVGIREQTKNNLIEFSARCKLCAAEADRKWRCHIYNSSVGCTAKSLGVGCCWNDASEIQFYIRSNRETKSTDTNCCRCIIEHTKNLAYTFMQQTIVRCDTNCAVYHICYECWIIICCHCARLPYWRQLGQKWHVITGCALCVPCKHMHMKAVPEKKKKKL